MRILVIGATGGTGNALVAEALERGHEVTAFVRNPSSFTMKHHGLTVVQGNVLDGISLESAMKGHSAVVCALGHKQWFWPTSILSEGTSNIIAAMEKSGVHRFVCETSLGIGNSWGRMGLYYSLFVGNFILPFYFYDKVRQERIIRASSLEWVIVRPGQLTNGKKRGTYRHGDKIGNYLWTVCISRKDVADFMINQISSDQYLRQTVGVCG
ncbi:MAG: SDR family oxidoreductase [Candidatus Zixiibacteriota bacterium]